MKKIGYLGLGAWGYCLASLLANQNNCQVVAWTANPDLADHLNRREPHPRFKEYCSPDRLFFTTDLAKVLNEADLIVESVTCAGIRPVFEQMRSLSIPSCPIVITSKGIEQGSGQILPQVAAEVLGEMHRPNLCLLSGPSFAKEVIAGFPASVVASGYCFETVQKVCDLFTTPSFRVYPNMDIAGVAFGGALKNVIAIACGISHGLNLGNSSKAALMTRGLHEICKLALAYGCKSQTMYGLTGMGDLCLTCGSDLSRNFLFGTYLAQGNTVTQAQEKIGMVVEGAYTCCSALELGKKYEIEMPISKAVFDIMNGNLTPQEAVKALMQRTVKEEHL